MNKFKSFNPRQKITVEEYGKLLDEKFLPSQLAESLANKTEGGHYYREICARCGKSYGFHYGGFKEAFCEPFINQIIL